MTNPHESSPWRNCPDCKKLIHKGNYHNCNMYYCTEEYVPDKDQQEYIEWEIVYAANSREAAERYAAESDSNGDYWIAEHGEGTVFVKSISLESDNKVTEYHIEAETVVEYRATRKETSEPVS